MRIQSRRLQPPNALQTVVDGRVQLAPEPAPPGERRLRLPLAILDRTSEALADAGGRFVGLVVAQRPERALVAVFAYRGELVALNAALTGDMSVFGSLSVRIPACRLDELELQDREGLRPLAHPDARPVIRPDADDLRRRVTGPEAFTIPYGPIRSGVFEAIQFVIPTGGEDVLALDVRTFFKHRRLEERFAGLPLEHGAALAERVAGIAAVAHGIAFAQAVERALGVGAPPRAALWRTVQAELERIANHLDVATRLAEDAALSVAVARFGILKEDVQRLRAVLTGSRFGRGAVVPGGIASEPGLEIDDLLAALSRFERDLRRDRKLLLRTASFTDRLIGSGRLDRETLEAYAGVGPIARAAGISTDARYERPYAGYEVLGFEISTREQGDAMARLEVRFDEISQSLHLIRQALDRLRRAPEQLRSDLPDGAGAAFGWAEAPQGEVVYWVELSASRIDRVRIFSPSFRNWPLFAECFRGDVLTDFGFNEHSFGLTPAGADR
jgi:formate hydrogenlyase subunit 5